MPATSYLSIESNKQTTNETAESFKNPSTKKSDNVTMQDIKIGDEDNQTNLMREFEQDLVI